MGGAWHYVQLFHVERPRSSYCIMTGAEHQLIDFENIEGYSVLEASLFLVLHQHGMLRDFRMFG